MAILASKTSFTGDEAVHAMFAPVIKRVIREESTTKRQTSHDARPMNFIYNMKVIYATPRILRPNWNIAIAVDMVRTGFQPLPLGPVGPNPCQLRSAPRARSFKIPISGSCRTGGLISLTLHMLFP